MKPTRENLLLGLPLQVDTALYVFTDLALRGPALQQVVDGLVVYLNHAHVAHVLDLLRPLQAATRPA